MTYVHDVLDTCEVLTVHDSLDECGVHDGLGDCDVHAVHDGLDWDACDGHDGIDR